MATILEANGFELTRSVSCAQAFRWQRKEDCACDDVWFGMAGDKALALKQEGQKLILSCDDNDADFWRHYFSLDRDYAPMEALLAADPVASECLDSSRGIRIFRQEPFEALISFIISANNNFARICGIIDRMCQKFGEEKGLPDGQTYFAFPSPESLAKADHDVLRDIGAGYRAPYIQSTADRIWQNPLDWDAVRAMPFDEAKKFLQTFPGVGPKVAECVMLFSLGFDQAFPVDVWVARVSKSLYPGVDGKVAARKAAERFGVWAGAAQQYLFHHARMVGLGTKRHGKAKSIS